MGKTYNNKGNLLKFRCRVCHVRLISAARLREHIRKIHVLGKVRDRHRKKNNALEEQLYLNNLNQLQNKIDNERFNILIKEILPEVEIGQAYTAFANAIQPRNEDLLDIYNCVKSYINDVLEKIFDDYELHVYGSTIYGLALFGEY